MRPRRDVAKRRHGDGDAHADTRNNQNTHMLDPNSPSLRSCGAGFEWRPVRYDTINHAISTLLAMFTTGVHRYRGQMVALRNCCRSLRDAVDAAVDDWCARFELLRKVWASDYGGCRRGTLSLCMYDGEWVYKAQTDMITMWERAFVNDDGAPRHLSLIHI